MFTFVNELSIWQVVSVMITFAWIVSAVNHKYLKLPPSFGMTLIAVIFVVLIQFMANVVPQHIINLDKVESLMREFDFHDFLLNGILCYLLFATAIKVQISDLKKWWKPIAILSFGGVFVFSFLMAGLLYGSLHIFNIALPFNYCFILAACLAPTDPISANAVLKKLKVDKHLETKLIGEGLWNDAAALLIFLTALDIVTKDVEFSVINVSLMLVYELVGAVFVGFLIGIICRWSIRSLDDFTSIALATLSCASLSYWIASSFHLSGPISTVVAGLVVSYKLSEIFNNHIQEHLDKFWEFFDELLNASLFALIGIEVILIQFSFSIVGLGVLAFILMNLSRYISNRLLFYPMRKNIVNGSIEIVSWGGIRGGISVALGLLLLNNTKFATNLHDMNTTYANLIIGIIFTCVILSVSVQGMTLKYMINAFYPKKEELDKLNFIEKKIQVVFNKMNRNKNIDIHEKAVVSNGLNTNDISIENIDDVDLNKSEKF